MKIIKYGDGYPRRVTCVNCFSVLEIELSDIYSTKSTPTMTKNGVLVSNESKYVICPVCGDSNTIDENTIEFHL